MKTIIAFIILAAACAIPVQRDVAEYFYPLPIRDRIEKMNTPGGWKFSAEEWYLLKRGRLMQAPEYFNDPEHGSNGGYEIG